MFAGPDLALYGSQNWSESGPVFNSHCLSLNDFARKLNIDYNKKKSCRDAYICKVTYMIVSL